MRFPSKALFTIFLTLFGIGELASSQTVSRFYNSQDYGYLRNRDGNIELGGNSNGTEMLVVSPGFSPNNSTYGGGTRGFATFGVPQNANLHKGVEIDMFLNDFGSSSSSNPPNQIAVASYSGDGIVSTSDWDAVGSSSFSLETRSTSGGLEYELDVTSAFASHIGTRPFQSAVEFRFSPQSEPVFESFGRGTSIEVKDQVSELFKKKFIGTSHERNNPQIVIDFQAKNSFGDNITTQEILDATNSKEFNWINRMTKLPDSWLRKEVWLNVIFDGDDPQVYFDQNAGFFRHNRDDSPVIAYDANGPLIDQLPAPSANETAHLFFFNGTTPFEGNSDLNGWSAYANGASHPDVVGIAGQDTHDYYYNIGSSKFFDDAPTLPEGFLLPGEYVQFETELVLVNQDDSYTSTGLKVSWKSDRVRNDGGVLGVGGGTSNSIPGTGGIFDVRVFSTVPEPSTVSLGLALFGLSCMRRRKIQFRGN